LAKQVSTGIIRHEQAITNSMAATGGHLIMAPKVLSCLIAIPLLFFHPAATEPA
jgi:hypothetical protein